MTRLSSSGGGRSRGTVTQALGGLSPSQGRRVRSLLFLATLGQLRIFATFERKMKRTGGPGIIPFELVGSTARARQILHTWGPEGRAAARDSLLLDYLFPPTYGLLQALSCDAAASGLAKRGRRAAAAAGGVLGWLQLAAAAFDYVENTALLLVLAGRDRHAPRVARQAALVKFALISLGQAYMVLAGVGNAWGRWADRRSGSGGGSR